MKDYEVYGYNIYTHVYSTITIRANDILTVKKDVYNKYPQFVIVTIYPAKEAA